jgi:hypothetical protein
MAAANTDKFKKAKRRFSTTIGVGGFAAGATTLPLTSTTGLDTDTAITLVIEPGTADEEVITGVVSGNNIINCVRGKEGTNDIVHNAGDAVSMYFTETHWDDLVNGILQEHKQDGTHGILTATSVSTGAVSGTTGTFTGNVSDNSTTLQTYRSEQIYDFVASGCVWTGDSYNSTRVASMTSGVVYIGGKRVAVSAVTSRTFTASKDTYVDVNNTGAITYTEVTNNAASPSLSANNIRIAIIVTGASSIVSSASINQGSFEATLPSISSSRCIGVDSLGNPIYNRNPNELYILKASGGSSPTPSVEADLADSIITLNLPSAANVSVQYGAHFQQNSGATRASYLKFFIDGTVVNQIFMQDNPGAAETHMNLSMGARKYLTSGSHTLKLTNVASASSVCAIGDVWMTIKVRAI